MKTLLLSTAVGLVNLVAMGSVASAQCHGIGGYPHGSFGGYYAPHAYRGGFGPDAGYGAIPVARLPANMTYKAIETEEGIIIVAVPKGSAIGAALNQNPTVPAQPQIQPQVPPAPQPQVQPLENPQPQVAPASVVQNPTGPSSPFFNIPDRTIPSQTFPNGNGSQGFPGQGGVPVVNNGGNRVFQNVVNNGSVRNFESAPIPNNVNNGSVRNFNPAAAPAPNVNNGGLRNFGAPPPGNGGRR